MVIANTIILVVSSLLVIISCLFSGKPKLQYWLRLICGVLIITCGNNVMDKALNFSWVNSLIVMVLYLLVIFSVAKAVDNYYKKNAPNKK